MDRCKTLVIGGGPSGLAFAARLIQLGVEDVVVFERENETGGVPRHCGHWGFGWESHRSLCSGSDYADKLRRGARDVDVRVQHTVLKFLDARTVEAHSPRLGIFRMTAEHFVLACGARETTRAARLIGGVRNGSVMNTATLQQLVFLKKQKPFSRPVIIGGEWLSFSALMTCHHAGIKPVAMIVEEPKIEAPAFFSWGARLWYGVPVLCNAKVLSVEGRHQVTAIQVQRNHAKEVIACDGVIVTGKLRPEDTLLQDSSMELAALHRLGNMQGDIKTAGRCVAEARSLADKLANTMG